MERVGREQNEGLDSLDRQQGKVFLVWVKVAEVRNKGGSRERDDMLHCEGISLLLVLFKFVLYLVHSW